MADRNRFGRALRRFLAGGALVFAGLAVGSCSTSDEPSGGVSAPSSGTVVTGVVGEPGAGMLAGVSVQGGGAVTTTDAQGRFQLPIPSSGTTVIRLDREGFAPAYRPITPQGAALVTAPFWLNRHDLTTTIDVRTEAATVIVDQATLTFPQGSIVTQQGTEPTGPVELTATWLDRSSTGAAPAPLQAMDGGELTPLISYGMLEATLRVGDEPAQLAPGSEATLTVTGRTNDPQTAGMFHLDPTQGIWVEEGEASHDGTRWTASIPHLSWWNIDAFVKVPPDQWHCVRIVARDARGRPIPGVFIDVRWGAGLRSIGTTDIDGSLCSDRYPSEPLQITAVAYFGATAADAVVAQTTVTPTAPRVACDEPTCQVVELTLACEHDGQCAPGARCQGGTCGASPGGPGPGTGGSTGTGTTTGTGAGGGGSTDIPAICEDFIACLAGLNHPGLAEAIQAFGPGGDCYLVLPESHCAGECQDGYDSNCVP